ncbi:MAG TPA: zinc-binding alcohol dehydrogenase family protein [Burkholderiales bacterium]|nr:zinc-binding alcohol dehydrogenase family protein [Burkholderiales bacterium]
MKAIDHTFAEIELPKPSPAGRDLLIKVEAISVNPVDTKQRKTATGSKILGWDAAGTVEAVGSQTSLFRPGDQVYYAGDVTRSGCDSEFHLVDERIVGRKPKKLDFAQAAAMALTSITAWEAFYDRMHVVPGKTMLIIGGAGGVGSIGIQLAKSSNLKVIATASRPETVAWVKELGADQVVNHREDLVSQINKPVDYIANFSGDLDGYWPAMAELIAPQGAMVAIVGNQKPMPMDVVRSKSATVCWELMFTRSRFQTADMIEQHRLLNEVSARLDAGKLKCTLKETLTPISGANLKKAHERLESGTMIGKLVLKGWR